MQDGKETLLSWVARRLAAATPPLPVLASEAPHVVSPRLRVTVDEAAGALAAVETGVAAVRAELRSMEESSGSGISGGGGAGEGGPASAAAADEAGDGAAPDGVAGSGGGAAEALAATAAELEGRLSTARALLAACREGFASLAAFYGESAAALGSEQELWQPLAAFVERFTACQRAVQREAAEEAERLRRQASASKQAAGGSGRRQAAAAAAAAGRQPAAGSEDAAGGTLRPGSAARQLDFPSPPAA